MRNDLNILTVFQNEGLTQISINKPKDRSVDFLQVFEMKCQEDAELVIALVEQRLKPWLMGQGYILSPNAMVDYVLTASQLINDDAYRRENLCYYNGNDSRQQKHYLELLQYYIDFKLGGDFPCIDDYILHREKSEREEVISFKADVGSHEQLKKMKGYESLIDDTVCFWHQHQGKLALKLQYYGDHLLD